MLFIGILAVILIPSICFSVWIVFALDKGGREMHKELEKSGDKYIRHVGGFGESTFAKVSQ